MEDKVKGFIKKINNPFSSSSSSGKFKGQGRTLGSSDPSPSSNPSRPSLPDPNPNPNPKPSSSPTPASTRSIPNPNPKPSSSPTPESTRSIPNPNPKPSSSPTPESTRSIPNPNPNPKPSSSPTPASTRSIPNPNPKPSSSPTPESTRSIPNPNPKPSSSPTPESTRSIPNPNPKPSSSPTPESTRSIPNPNPNPKPSSSPTPASTRSIPSHQQPPSDPQISNGSNTNLELSSLISSIQSRGVSVEVIIKILKNIIKEPENPKFRRIRLSNPKIKEAIVDVVGGVELLELLGFKLQDENGEMWAVMSDVLEEDCGLAKEAVLLLEKPVVVPGFSIRWNSSTSLSEKDEGSVGVLVDDEPELRQKIDRQVQVFFSVPESITAKADLPESFYSLSAMELKREADARKKQLADSQLLIPKSYKEKKAKEAKKKYKTTTIRIQFPDQVVLQGIFVPGEPTTALYEFVSSALKQPCLEFELWQPAYPKPRVIPRFPQPNKRTQTLEDEELVPAALIKFKPIETDSVVFTGLSNELLESCLATQS